jgi:hypothetical protein
VNVYGTTGGEGGNFADKDVLEGRGGEGGVMLNGRVYFPVSDGHGCPACGAVWPGGHGGYCPHARRFNEDGLEILAASGLGEEDQ